MRVALLIVIVIAFAAGCAKYEYALIKPPEQTRHIGRKIDQKVAIDPLEYRLRTEDNRLILRIFNPTNDPIELIGHQSAVVDPDGQSHPLRGQSIAPQSFIKVIIPPPRPQYYDPGPTIGFGVGMHTSHYHHDRCHRVHHHCHFPDPTPQYFVVFDEDNAYYWNWKGEGEARVNMVFRRGQNEFRHELAFRRIKM